MYGIDDRIKWLVAAVALILAGLFATGNFPPTSQQNSLIRYERDVYIIDSTSTDDTWASIRTSMLNRLKSPFGQYVVDGSVIAAEDGGAMADMVVVAVSPNGLNQSGVEILTGQTVTSVWDTFMQGANLDRAQTIYQEMLAPNSSVWAKIVEKYLPSTGASSITTSSCVDFAIEAIGDASASKSRGYLESEGVSQHDSATTLCNLLAGGLDGIAKSEDLLSQSQAECEARNRKRCSDIPGATSVVADIVSDAASLDGRLQRHASLDSEIKYRYSACLLYGSDMITMNSTEVMQDELRTWTKLDAKKFGKKASKELLDGGFDPLSGGILVAMPKLGVKDGKFLSPTALTNLEAYWKSFFMTAGAEIDNNSTKLACDGQGGF
jgi:hypothetical protein